MTRVLIVNAHGADERRGGAERYVAELVRGLPSRGLDVSVLSAFPSDAPAEAPTTVLHRTDWTEDRTRRLRNHLGALSSRPTRQLEAAVAAAAPDVVHTHNLPGITTAVWEVARRASVPVVHCLHDYHLLCPRVTLLQPDGSPCRPHPLLCGLRARRLGRWAGAVSTAHGPSEHILRRHGELFEGAETRVIRHPADQRPGRELRAPAVPPKTLGFIGALDRTKGVDVLLEAAPLLRERGIELRIAGDGRLRAEVMAAPVSYVGLVSGAAKDDFLESCDAGVVPSVWEEPAGPPFAVLEWLSAGRSVIASRRGGLAESADLPGVRPAEPTPAALAAALEPPLPAPRPAAYPGDRDRWLDEHAELLRR